MSSIAVSIRRRDKNWKRERALHLSMEGECQWCGGVCDLEVHHIIPVHKDPSKELDHKNMITLCMADGFECHYRKGHRGTSWLDYDPDIRSKCEMRNLPLVPRERNERSG